MNAMFALQMATTQINQSIATLIVLKSVVGPYPLEIKSDLVAVYNQLGTLLSDNKISDIPPDILGRDLRN